MEAGSGRVKMPAVSRPPPGVLAHPDVPLAGRTTLAVGGPARWLVEAATTAALRDALAWAIADGVEPFVLGGGSNLLVSDAGFDGLVVQPTADDIQGGEGGLVSAAAGCDWDRLVAWTVARGLAGLECLSGIPGRVGAAPIQNIGAYGQEVCEAIEAVHVLEIASGAQERLPGEACGFGYRSSHFKGAWRGRYVVTRVDFRLEAGGAPRLRYEQVRRQVEAGALTATPTVAEVRRVVRSIRASKSMIYDPTDPNHRSAGSFFMNPVLEAPAAAAVAEAVARRGGDPAELPRYPQPDGRVKLSAAWLIERAGFTRGTVDGRVGQSTRHALALINRGGATAADLVRLAGRIRRGVRDAFEVTLWPEPVFLGFDAPQRVLLEDG